MRTNFRLDNQSDMEILLLTLGNCHRDIIIHIGGLFFIIIAFVLMAYAQKEFTLFRYFSFYFPIVETFTYVALEFVSFNIIQCEFRKRFTIFAFAHFIRGESCGLNTCQWVDDAEKLPVPILHALDTLHGCCLLL